jgi:hypothetical protein
MTQGSVFPSPLCHFYLEAGVGIVHNPRERSTSIDHHYSCPKRLSRMITVEYRAAALDDGVTMIYKCTRCGKRTRIVHGSMTGG